MNKLVVFIAVFLVLLFITLGVLVAVHYRTPKAYDAASVAKLAELSRLPEGIKVVHDPSPVRAVHQEKGHYTYAWMHSTTVTAVDDTIEIIEFGAFAWHDGEWVMSTIFGRPFNAEEFADWYSCPGCIIAKGESATDPSNYSGMANELSNHKSRWYYIGKNSKGEKVKGEAIIQSVAELRE